MSGESYVEAMRRLRTLATGGTGRDPPPIEPPRARDDDDGMEGRIRRLEDDVRAIRGDLTTINGRLGSVEAKLDMVVAQMSGLAVELRGKIPGVWQLVTAVLALFTGLAAVLGIAVKLAQWFRVIPG